MVEKPRILFISNLFPDAAQRYRGLDNATLLHCLQDRCDVRVLSPRPALPFRWRAPKVREEDQNLSPQFVPSYYVPKFGSRWNHRLMARALREPVKRAKGEFGFDAVLCSWLFPDACAVATLAKEMDFPFVAISQGSDAHQYLRSPLRKSAITHALARSRGVITRSAELGRLLGEAGVDRRKLRTVYNGVDLDLFQPGDRAAARAELSLLPEAPIILFVGNFFPVKNPLLLVRTHQRLRQSFPDCRLLMIGAGELEAQMRQEGGEGLEILGRRNSREIANYMRAADVLCVPSLNEGVPNVILEAFASGLRIVATRVGGIAEVLNNDTLGTLVASGDEAALASALTAALRSPPNREGIREHGLQFSWERAASQYFEMLTAPAPESAS